MSTYMRAPRRSGFESQWPRRRWGALKVRVGCLALSLGLFCPGCGTLITQIDGPLFAPGEKAFDWDEKPASPIYSGTRLSLGGALKSDAYYVWWIDLPFSFVADTALLPLTVPQALIAGVVERFADETIEPEAGTASSRSE